MLAFDPLCVVRGPVWQIRRREFIGLIAAEIAARVAAAETVVARVSY
jgi:hypothetical protein